MPLSEVGRVARSRAVCGVRVAWGAVRIGRDRLIAYGRLISRL